MTFEEFKREWGIDGMPHDKIRLATAAWDAATRAENEACAERLDTLDRVSGRVAAYAIRQRMKESK